MSEMFFENWYEIWRIFISCLVAYTVFIIFLRISGKRTLSKWNAFDFIVTIALGSILAGVILSKDTLILEGIFAAALLIILQFTITFLASRIDFIDNVIKANPTLLYYKGSYRTDAMKNQRVAKSEILSAVRTSSIGSMEKVEAVVLETDGEFSVIEKSENSSGEESSLQDVEGFSADNHKN